jgi:hypothetical protein
MKEFLIESNSTGVRLPVFIRVNSGASMVYKFGGLGCGGLKVESQNVHPRVASKPLPAAMICGLPTHANRVATSRRD